jgi:hypothetical protein
MAALDAFGRLRVAGCFTTFNYYPSTLTANTSLDIDVWVPRETTPGTQTYNSQNYINMPITTGATNYSLRTTKQPMLYQPGKSRLIYMTGVLMTSTGAGTDSHMGLFSVDTSTPPIITEGTYLRCDGTNLIFEDVTQSGTTSVVQSSWNIDTFNGNGPSGKTLTIANAAQTLLLVMDQEWLGVGRIRCGFIIDGVIYYGHQFLHNGLTVQYTKTPRIYLSYYIKGTVANAMRQMCCTSIIEDGYFSTGRINNLNNSVSGTTPFVAVNTTQDRVLLGIKVQTGYPLSTFFLKNLSFYYLGDGGSNGKYAQFKIYMFSTNGSIGALNYGGVIPNYTPTFTPLINSSIEYFIGDGIVYVTPSNSLQVGYKPGFIIGSGYLDTQTSFEFVSVVNDSLQTRNLFTKYDTLYVTGIANSAGTMGTSVTFIEDI